MSKGSDWLPPGARPPRENHSGITEGNVKRTVSRMERASRQQAAPATPVSCSQCGSEQITANKKGFGVGKAIAGGVITGGVGLLAGFIGSRKVQVTCLNCGHSWTAGK